MLVVAPRFLPTDVGFTHLLHPAAPARAVPRSRREHAVIEPRTWWVQDSDFDDELETRILRGWLRAVVASSPVPVETVEIEFFDNDTPGQADLLEHPAVSVPSRSHPPKPRFSFRHQYPLPTVARARWSVLDPTVVVDTYYDVMNFSDARGEIRMRLVEGWVAMAVKHAPDGLLARGAGTLDEAVEAWAR